MKLTANISRLRSYPAPLSREPKALLRTGAWLAGDALRGRMTPPPSGTFKSYFAGMPQEQVKAFFDFRRIAPLQGQELFAGLLDSKVVNLVKGCDVQCDYCYALASGRIQSMPWDWVEEISQWLPKGPDVSHDIAFDGDPLRNYFDPFRNKDFGDAAKLIDFHYLPTAGFNIGSAGERSAEKIAADRDKYEIRINFSLLSKWAGSLGADGYTETMKNVFSILKPDCVYVFHDGNNYGDTIKALDASGGMEFECNISLPHRDGRAFSMPDKSTEMQPGGTPLTRSAFILDPDGTIRFAAREKNSHRARVIREYGGRIASDDLLLGCYFRTVSDVLQTLHDCAKDGWI